MAGCCAPPRACAAICAAVLIMRPARDFGASRDFKRSAIGELRAYGFDLQLGFEDDRRNVEMLHAEGIPCVYIHSGYYD